MFGVIVRRLRRGLAFVTRLRDAALETWRSGDPHGLDVAAIEHMDARCLALLREDGADRQYGVVIPDRTAIALLVTLELPPGLSSAQAFDEIGRARESNAPDSPLIRLCRALDEAGVLDAVEIAVPGDLARAGQLLALREAVPAGVNARVGRAKQTIDRRIAKTAADMIVPFERLEELLTIYDEEFARRGLDAAVWGHISDGNLHPNVIPRSMADVESGKEAILSFGRDVIRLGGSPLAEHGVGRNPVKQQLLLELYGREGVEEMRAAKRAIDSWSTRLRPACCFQTKTKPPSVKRPWKIRLTLTAGARRAHEAFRVSSPQALCFASTLSLRPERHGGRGAKPPRDEPGARGRPVRHQRCRCGRRSIERRVAGRIPWRGRDAELRRARKDRHAAKSSSHAPPSATRGAVPPLMRRAEKNNVPNQLTTAMPASRRNRPISRSPA